MSGAPVAWHDRPPRTIAIFRALQLGDLLCAVPALRALRGTFPQAHVALIGLPWARAFVDRFATYLDEFVEFPGFPGLPEQPPRVSEFPEFLRRVQGHRFDWIVQMHGNGQLTNDLVSLLAGQTVFGYRTDGGYCPDPQQFMLYPNDLPEVRRHLRLVEFLGVAPAGEALEFPLSEEDWASFEQIDGIEELVPGAYACVHPGGRGVNRRWAPECFAGVADALAAQGLRVVLTGSTEERSIGDAVERAMHSKPVNLIGRTTLGSLGVLLHRARLLISNDTGVSHLAAALKLPSVIIVVGSDPLRWGPLDRERHQLLIGPSTEPEIVVRTAQALLARGMMPVWQAPTPRLASPLARADRSAHA